MEKYNYLVVATELFSCWDTRRLGHITIEELAEQLISFGLSVSKEQVVKLLQAITVRKGVIKTDLEEITLKEFLKIFERDIFGDKVVKAIKGDWLENRRQAEERILALTLRSKTKGIKRSDSEITSQKSYSVISQSSKGKSLYTSLHGRGPTESHKDSP